MGPLHVMLGFSGRIGRGAFAFGLIVAAALFVLGIRVSTLRCPSVAEVLAPHGINAGLALNAFWSVVGPMLVWSLIALGAKRLRDRGRSPWWVVVVVLPLAALTFANDAIFLVSRYFVVQREVQLAVLIELVLIGLWVLAECLVGPSVVDETRKLPTREPPSS